MNELKKEFEKEKRNWELYGPLGMGIAYPKLWSWIQTAISKARGEGYTKGKEAGKEETVTRFKKKLISAYDNTHQTMGWHISSEDLKELHSQDK